jgi:membrane-bound inhibitor of C-type lysozyme
MYTFTYRLTYYMRNKLIILGIIIVIAIITGLVAGNGGTPKPTDATVENTLSFMCDDTSYFVAEFMSDKTLNILVDGNLVRTLMKEDVDRQQYDDETYSYIFAGEEATVANKEKRTIVTCNQPFDPNNAPYNFGDRGEGAGSYDIAAVAQAQILGTWRSIEDPKFTRTFGAEGMVTDAYDGESSGADVFSIFTQGSDNAPDMIAPLEAGSAYVQIMTRTEPRTTMTYQLLAVTPDRLEMLYLDRGNTLVFEKVQ